MYATVGGNPVAHAMYFKDVVDTFFHDMLRFNRATPGVFGVVRAYRGEHEETGRGNNHAHNLIWTATPGLPRLLEQVTTLRAKLTKELRALRAEAEEDVARVLVQKVAVRALMSRRNESQLQLRKQGLQDIIALDERVLGISAAVRARMDTHTKDGVSQLRALITEFTKASVGVAETLQFDCLSKIMDAFGHPGQAHYLDGPDTDYNPGTDPVLPFTEKNRNSVGCWRPCIALARELTERGLTNAIVERGGQLVLSGTEGFQDIFTTSKLNMPPSAAVAGSAVIRCDGHDLVKDPLTKEALVAEILRMQRGRVKDAPLSTLQISRGMCDGSEVLDGGGVRFPFMKDKARLPVGERIAALTGIDAALMPERRRVQHTREHAEDAYRCVTQLILVLRCPIPNGVFNPYVLPDPDDSRHDGRITIAPGTEIRESTQVAHPPQMFCGVVRTGPHLGVYVEIDRRVWSSDRVTGDPYSASGATREEFQAYFNIKSSLAQDEK
jgi:hypothetical protein